MLENNFIIGQLEEFQQRRAERRRFMKLAATGAAAVGGLSLLAACGDDNDNDTSPTPTPTPTLHRDCRPPRRSRTCSTSR